MANALYPPAAEGFIAGEIDLDTAVIKAAFVRGYTYSASHKFVSDVTGAGGTLNGTSAALASKTVTNGVFDAADTTVTTTASAVDHGILLFQASAVTGGADVAATAQRVIAWYDTGTGLPIQPGTGSTPITWDNGTNKILKVG
jgi:hypothetical protein